MSGADSEGGLLAGVGVVLVTVSVAAFGYDLLTGSPPRASLYLHVVGISAVMLETVIEQYRSGEGSLGFNVGIGTVMVAADVFLVAVVVALLSPFHGSDPGAFASWFGGAFYLAGVGIVLGVLVWTVELGFGGLLWLSRRLPVRVPSPPSPPSLDLDPRGALDSLRGDAADPTPTPATGSPSASRRARDDDGAPDDADDVPTAAGIADVQSRDDAGPLVRVDGWGETGAPATVYAPSERVDLSADGRAAFVETAREWASLASYDGVVTVEDVGESPRPWVRAERPPEETLAGFDGSVETLVDLLADVCTAVRNADRYNISHTGLRGDCVYVSEEGALVGDWGLSRVALDATDVGVTPWDAPEQVAPDAYPSPGSHTDVYRIGVVGYRALTGEFPCAHEVADPLDADDDALAAAIEAGDPVAPSRLADVPAGLDEPILSALAVDPDDRPSSATALRTALVEAVT